MKFYNLARASMITILISGVALQANAQRERRGERDRPERSSPPTRREPARSTPSVRSEPRVQRDRQPAPRAQPSQPSTPRVVRDRQPSQRVERDRQPAPRVERDRQPSQRVERDRDRNNNNNRVRPNPGNNNQVRPNQPGQNRQVRQHRRNFERPVNVRRNGRDVVERSRVRHVQGRDIRVNRYYRPHRWGHHNLYSYRPYWTYNSGFWNFYRHRYVSPWSYTWGWYTSPWYSSWSWYYRPYSHYYSASYWVTDYVIADLLREQYEEGYADGFRDGWNDTRSSGITEEYKEQIRSQVDQTVNAYENDRTFSVDQAFDDSSYLFAVDTQITVLDQNNSVCTLSGGDLLRVYNRPQQDDNYASMQVVTSKGASCQAGSVVSISIDDLQEMLNTFNEKVDDGLNEAQKLQTRLP